MMKKPLLIALLVLTPIVVFAIPSTSTAQAPQSPFSQPDFTST